MARSHGLTLIEVVVALAILAMCLGALYQMFGQTLRRASQIRERELAFMTAQSILESAAGHRLFKPQHRAGRTPEGLQWELDIAPYGEGEFGDLVIRPVLIEVQVSRGERREPTAQLRAIELGEIEAQ